MHREGNGEPMDYNASIQQIIIPIPVVNDLLRRFMIIFNIKNRYGRFEKYLYSIMG